MRPTTRRFGSLAQPLDEILGATSRVRVLRALDRVSEPTAPATIARETGLSHNAVLAALDTLVRAGLVSENVLGSRSIYLINPRHPFTAPLAMLFAAERYRRQAVRIAVEAWAEHEPGALAIWLFGSAARREDTLGSDVDLAIVGRSQEIALDIARGLADGLESLVSDHHITVNVIGYDASEILAMPESDPGMWNNLVRDANALIGPRPEELRNALVHEGDRLS